MAGFEVEIEILGTYFFLFFHEKIGVDETYPPQSRDFLSNYSVTTQSAELQMIMKVIMTWGDNTFCVSKKKIANQKIPREPLRKQWGQKRELGGTQWDFFVTSIDMIQ